MRTLPLALTMAFFLVLSGCGDLLSVQPLASAETTVFDASLLGEWSCSAKECKGTVLIRAESPEKKIYDIVWVPGEADGEALRLQGRLVKVGDRQVFDLVTVKRADLSVPGHFFMLMQKTGGGVTFHWLDSEWLRKQVTAGNGLAFTLVEEKPVITSDAQSINAFLKKFGLDPRAASGNMPFKRVGRN